MKFSIFFYCFFLLSVSVLHAENLLEKVKNNEFLLAGNLAVFSIGSERHLVSVGTAEIKSSDPSAIKRARVMAKVRAQNQLSQFINDTRIEITEVLENKIQVVEEYGQKPLTQQKETYIELIREATHGKIGNIITLDAWRDKNIYFYVFDLPFSP